jgi:hypothetical protein
MDNPTQFPDGYAAAPHWVMRNALIPPHAKLVYVYMEGRLNEDGVCWPSHTTTAGELGISEASVKRAVTWMRKNKLVTVKRKSKGYGTYNIYQKRTMTFRYQRIKTRHQRIKTAPTKRSQ